MSLTPGTLVVCDYRMPSAIQPWLGTVHVGVVEPAGTDSSTWNGTNTEAHYCRVTGKVRVNYGSFVQHDRADSLHAVGGEVLDMSHAERVRHFLGEVAYVRLVKSSGQEVAA